MIVYSREGGYGKVDLEEVRAVIDRHLPLAAA